jgi:DNA-binding LytR/AlgR family response regulator
MIRIAICDDDKKALVKNKQQVQSCMQEMKRLAQVIVYQSGKNLQYDIKEGKYFDLILLDIEMPETSGIDIAKMIKDVSPQTLVVFLTSHSEYAMTSYELSIFRYISKDNMELKLFEALRDAVNCIELQRDKVYIINSPTRYQKVPYEKILYIKKEGKNTVLFTKEKPR